MQDEDKKQRLPLYLTPDELRRIRIAAAYVGLSMAEYAKRQVLASVDQQEAERKAGE